MAGMLKADYNQYLNYNFFIRRHTALVLLHFTDKFTDLFSTVSGFVGFDVVSLLLH